jgi:hypothetical protein
MGKQSVYEIEKELKEVAALLSGYSFQRFYQAIYCLWQLSVKSEAVACTKIDIIELPSNCLEYRLFLHKSHDHLIMATFFKNEIKFRGTNHDRSNSNPGC